MNTYYATAEIARQRRCGAEAQARRHREANAASETTSAAPARPAVPPPAAPHGVGARRERAGPSTAA